MTLVLRDLPNEILSCIWECIPFMVVRTVCRKTHEQRNAERLTPTGPAHCIHIAIQRFHWRWVTPIQVDDLQQVSRPLGCDKTIFGLTTRESSYVDWTLRFHDKWTGPPIPYIGYVHHQTGYQGGLYVGGQ